VCGIWGLLLRGDDRRAQRAQCSLRDALVHRGPDDEGKVVHGEFAFGMTRLGIVDPAGGKQPFTSADGRYSCVVNGEIYNSSELRARLEARAHTFRTGSDCETVLHLYEERGAECVRELRGMFAFAVLDRQKGTLVLGRDRLGEKPLYYSAEPGHFVFASELKALLSSGIVPFRLSPVAVHEYFHFQFVPEPRSPVLEVHKLPPGHVLELNLRTLGMHTRQYWSLADVPAATGSPEQVLVAALEKVQSLVFRADTPVGVALSGGLDSALVASMLARARPGEGHAFSVGYTGAPSYDERVQAGLIADTLGLHFHEIELSVAEVVEAFPSVVRAGDDPIADTAAPAYHAVAARARQAGVPVLAQGQGGDELFWGYRWVADAGRRAAVKPPEPGEPLLFYQLNSGYAEARREVPKVLTAALLDQVDPDGPARAFTREPGETVPNAITRLITETYLLENGMALGDRLAMANGVELRLPLIDHHFVTAVLGLRRYRSDLDLPPKWRLRRAAQHWLPEEVTQRPKRPFETPVNAWSRALYARYGSLLVDGCLVNLRILRPEVATELMLDDYHPSRATPASYKALVLELWVREMLALPGVRTS
jgi:asparagine synthase (glutamine-hydrolysing)